MRALRGYVGRAVPAVLLVFCSLGAEDASACFAAPPPEKWFFAPDGSCAVRQDNETGVIEVYAARGDEKPSWSAKLSDFGSPGFAPLVTPDGATIVHLRSNYVVERRGDLAVEIVRKDGTRHAFRASDFVPAILRCRARASASPKYLWHGPIGALTDTHFEFTTAWCRTAEIDLASGDVSLSGPFEWWHFLDMRAISWLHLRIAIPAVALLVTILAVYRWLRRRRARSAPSVRKAALYTSLAIVGALTLAAFVLRYGDTQSRKCFYIFQAYLYPGGWIGPPDDYTGIWRRWHLNGRLMSEENYENGKLLGTSTSWDSDGRKERQDFCEGGKLTKQIRWFTDGQKWYELNYRDNKQHGREMQCDPTGKWYILGTWKDGVPWEGRLQDKETNQIVTYKDGEVQDTEGVPWPPLDTEKPSR